jgi:thiamine pyrophosphate-dependent acetolactate synthase large subunit-like protein
MVTGIKAAQLNHSPVVVLSPTATSDSIGTDGFQEADTMSIFADCVDWQGRLEDRSRIAEYVRTAHREALARNGPAQIDFPRDRLYGEIDVDVLAPHQYRNSNVGSADRDGIERASELLAEAERPAIVAGLGVIYSGAIEEVAALAETLAAPVANSYLHNDSFPSSHPLAVGPLGYGGSKAAMDLLSEADRVLAVGTRLSGFGLLPQYGKEWFPGEADVIQIDADPSQIGRTTPVECGLVGDGAWGMQSMNAVMTAVREDVPAVAVVFDNGVWGAEKQNQYWFYEERFIGTDLPENPDFAAIAREMGATGTRVEEPEAIAPAIGDAIDAGEPAVIEVSTDGTELLEPFRRDALDEPTRLLEKYRRPAG